jgi:lipid-binding SYLF domain-containing protein
MTLPRLALQVLASLLLLWSPLATAGAREDLDTRVQEALEALYRTAPAARELAARADGMLVFPAIYKGGMFVGAEYGEGALLQGGQTSGYYNVASASVGLQLGVQRKSVVILFMTAEALARFERLRGFRVGVDGSVAIATLGAGGSIDTETIQDPVIGFVYSNQGLMYNLTLEGSKISRIRKE